MLYRLHSRQLIPHPLDKIWPFFLRPENLNRITPPDLGFVIRSPVPSEMTPGLIITYTVRPLMGIPVSWVTEITHLHPPAADRDWALFVDEQRFGPYRFWHHRHLFTQQDQTTLMEDEVHYGLPLGFLGRLVHPWLIRPRLMAIFSYRSRIIEQLYEAQSAEISISYL
jgi:ligand-binding SRPBCC domain-containing protein